MFDHRNEAMANASPRRFVKVAPPTVHAGVGNALRQAFGVQPSNRVPHSFHDLLAQLDCV
jgi:hypothetical protein